jgi:beta-glucosidase
MNLNIKLGAASSATQIEGGSLSHTWSDWYEKGHIRDGASPARANDHYNRWKEDIDIMAELGIKVYRLGIEWARLEPERGKYNDEAKEEYRSLLAYMKSAGIEPLLTIHHFTNPLWFESIGGFTKPANIPVYLDFVEYIINCFGDLVDEYVTINEPNVFAVMGYFEGIFPPGKRSMFDAFRVQSVMAACHIKAYKLIHKLRKEKGYTNTKVGFAHHARVFEPKSKNNLWHRICTSLVERFFQGALVPACLLGRFSFPLKKYGRIKPGEYADFLGLNYYARSSISGLGDGVRKGVHVNDLGWEIYPLGIAQCAQKLYDYLPRPVYITENGTCDNLDTFRSRYIYEHLKVLSESNLPVERYYHWCFTDNFEWCEGESARFGLVHVNYDTQKRTVKRSGRFYAAMIKNNGVTEDMFKEYVQPQLYPVN